RRRCPSRSTSRCSSGCSGRSLPAPRRGGPTLRGDDLSRSPSPLRLLDLRGDESVNAGQGSGEEQDKGEQDHQEPADVAPRVRPGPRERPCDQTHSTGDRISGAVPRPATINTGPPGPRVIRSPSRRGTAVVTRSSFRKVPCLDPASRTASPPAGLTVSSAWMRDTTVSGASTGWTSHS